jgi:hypothetical protein
MGGLIAGLTGALTAGGLTGVRPSGTRGAGGAGVAGAVAFRAGSRMVPHNPQNKKLLALTSPHFGQITGVLRIPLF